MKYFDITNGNVADTQKITLLSVDKINDAFKAKIGGSHPYYPKFKNLMKEMEKNEVESYPPLFAYKNYLKSIWENIPEGSLITSRSCFRKLYFFPNDFVLKFERVSHDSKTYIVLQSADDKMTDKFIQNCFQYRCFVSCLTGRDISSTTDTFRYDSFNLDEAKIQVHYTSLIDLFDHNDDPISVSLFPLRQYDRYVEHMCYDKAFSSGVKCHFAGIQKVIAGYHEDEKLQKTQEYTYEQLKEISSKSRTWNIDNAAAAIKGVLAVILNEFKAGKEKKRLINKAEIDKILEGLKEHNI
jgi:hypothetical protein